MHGVRQAACIPPKWGGYAGVLSSRAGWPLTGSALTDAVHLPLILRPHAVGRLWLVSVTLQRLGSESRRHAPGASSFCCHRPHKLLIQTSRQGSYRRRPLPRAALAIVAGGEQENAREAVGQVGTVVRPSRRSRKLREGRRQPGSPASWEPAVTRADRLCDRRPPVWLVAVSSAPWFFMAGFVSGDARVAAGLAPPAHLAAGSGRLRPDGRRGRNCGGDRPASRRTRCRESRWIGLHCPGRH